MKNLMNNKFYEEMRRIINLDSRNYHVVIFCSKGIKKISSFSDKESAISYFFSIEKYVAISPGDQVYALKKYRGGFYREHIEKLGYAYRKNIGFLDENKDASRVESIIYEDKKYSVFETNVYDVGIKFNTVDDNKKQAINVINNLNGENKVKNSMEIKQKIETTEGDFYFTISI